MVEPMEIAAVIERVERLSSVDADASANAVELEAALVTARQLAAWVEARQASVVARLNDRVSFPEATIGAASKISIGQASKTKERSDTLGRIPSLADRLDHGAITAGHIDVVTRSSKQLDERQRTELFDRVDQLAAVTEAATVDEFRRRVALEATKLLTDDGIDRLTRQRRDTRLRTWTDAEGMWCLNGRLDPVSGLKVASKLAAAVETLFAEATPEHAPADPIERQRFLAAHALTRLLDGAGSAKPGRAEFVAVIDADAPNRLGPAVEFAIPIELPASVIADLVGEANTHAVVVRNGVVLHAPGQLDQGRATRLANRSQRRALRGLYPACGIPGCSVHYDRCELHHIIWWRNGGRTDLSNLIPLCSVHHHKVHDDGWIITLGPNRQLTLRLPDGSVRATGPPTIRAA